MFEHFSSLLLKSSTFCGFIGMWDIWCEIGTGRQPVSCIVLVLLMNVQCNLCVGACVHERMDVIMCVLV